MIVKYNEKFDKLLIRDLSEKIYQELKKSNETEFVKHIWGESEPFFPIDVDRFNLHDRQNDDLYFPSEKYKHQDIYYNISAFPNILVRQRSHNLVNYQIRIITNNVGVEKGVNISNGLYFGYVFLNQLTSHEKFNHIEISDKFDDLGKSFDVNNIEIHKCQVYFNKVSEIKRNLIDYDLPSISNMISNFYDTYHADFENIISKYARVFIKNSGKIYE